MKKLCLFVLSLFFLIGCTKNVQSERLYSDAYVSVEAIYNGIHPEKLKFVPNENTIRYEYIVSNKECMNGFVSGSLENTVVVNDMTELLISLEDLDRGTVYYVYVRGYDNKGIPGAVSTEILDFSIEPMDVELSYLTESTAGVVVKCSSFYQTVRYYLGKEKDREAFINDRVASEYSSDIIEKFGVNWFDLEPNTDYVFYAVGYDRKNMPTGIYELPFTTSASSDDIAFAEFKILSLDFYKGTYEVVPNANCNTIVAAIIEKGVYDPVLFGKAAGRGDIKAIMTGWWLSGMMAVSSTGGNVLEYELKTKAMALDQELEAYIMVCDKDNNPTGIYHYDFSTPSYNPKAGLAEVEIDVSGINSRGAVYTYKPNENTVAYFYDTIDAEWLEDKMENGEYNDTFLHETLKSQGFYLGYGNSNLEFIEDKGSPDTRYYAAACPMNENGPKGWGPVSLFEYRTTLN